MSEITTTTAPKTEVKKTVAKTAQKADAKASTSGKPGLRKPQYRILKCLAKSPKPLTRAQIAEKAPVDQAACVEYIGSHDGDIRKANDAKHFPSLVSLGLVKHEQHDVDGRDVVVYMITAKGKAVSEKAPKE